MRPTWHFVARDDIRWLLELTAPRVNIKAGPNYRKYELDAATFKRSNKALIKALRGGKHLTRPTLKASARSRRGAKTVTIMLSPSGVLTNSDRLAIARATEPYAAFVGLPAEIVYQSG